MPKGIDYAFTPHPSPGAMAAAGIKFAGRYASQLAINDVNGKNLLRAERDALLNAEIEIIMFAEPGDPKWMLGGRAAGVTQAKHFDAVTKALGLAGIPAYYAADFDVGPSQQAAVNAALDGASSVRGPNLTGIYGGYFAVKRALDAGKAKYACQTLAWSGTPRRDGGPGAVAHDPHCVFIGSTNWDRRAQVRQHLQIRVGGVSVDWDTSMADDYGQWPRPAAAKPPPAAPAMRKATGKLSLRKAVNAESTTVMRSLFLMAHAPGAEAAGNFGPLQREYLLGEDFDAPMPAGMVYWVG